MKCDYAWNNEKVTKFAVRDSSVALEFIPLCMQRMWGQYFENIAHLTMLILSSLSVPAELATLYLLCRETSCVSSTDTKLR